MKQLCSILTVLALALGLFASQILLAGAPKPPDGSPKGPPSPEQIAKLCIAQTTFAANHCVQRNELRSAHCVEIIAQLLTEGRIDAAQHVGQMCIHYANVQSNHCIHFIQHRTAVCSFVLNMLGARGLAEQVQMNSQAKAQTIHQSRQAAIQAITAALNGGG